MAKGFRTATRVRKARADRLDPQPVGEDKLYLSGLIILPRQAYEAGRGWYTVEGWDIYVMPTSRVAAAPGGQKRKWEDGDVVSTDVLVIDGERWQVDGPIAPFDKGHVRKATRIQVKKVGGS